MKKIMVMMTLILLTGCAAAPLKVDIADLDKSASVKIEDLRPENESQKEAFSYLITSSAYGIYRNADTVVIPSPLRLLQHEAYEKLGNSKPLDIKVYHFVSYTNAQATLRTGAAGSIFGAIGAGIAVATKNNDANFSYSEINRDKFEALAGENEYTRAQCTAQENPNKATVFVIYLDAEINGNRKIIKTVSPSESDNNSPPYVNALENTIDTLIDSISKST